MRALLRTWCLLAASLPCLAKDGTSVLTLVNEAGFNEVSITVGASGLSDTDTSTLSGTANAHLIINANTDEVLCLTLSGGAATGTPISLNASAGIFGGFTVNSTTLGGFVETPNAPLPVTAATGEFDATKVDFVINSGNLTGESRVFGSPPSPIDVDLSEVPFRGNGSGLGTVALTETASTATSKTYDVVLQSAILIDNLIDFNGQSVDVDTSGTLKSIGTVTVDLPSPFDLWTFANGIPCALFDGDENNDGVQNGLQWAFGLTPSEDPSECNLEPMGPGGGGVQFELNLPPGGSAADIVVEGTTDPGTTPFAPVASSAVSSGNPIPAGTTGTVTVTCPPGKLHLLRLSVPAP